MRAGKRPAAGDRLSADRRKAPAREGKRKPVLSPPDSEVRMDKIEKIREALNRGEYKVAASKVAAKMLDELRRR